MPQLLGEILLEQRQVSSDDLSRGLSIQREIGGLLGQTLHRIGAVSEEALISVLSTQLSLAVLGPDEAPQDAELVADTATSLNLPKAWLKQRRAVLWRNGDSRLRVLAANPLDQTLRERIDKAVRTAAENQASDLYQVSYFLGPAELIEQCLSLYDARTGDADLGDEDDEHRLRELAEEAPVIDYVNNLLSHAIKSRASDIHIEAFERNVIVRFRIDGVMREHETFARARFDAITSRIKLIAGMDIAERRLPQDGRSTLRFAGHDVDLRISSVPSIWGEGVVIRLLKKRTELPDLKGLGIDGPVRDSIEKIIQNPNGIFLVTGPTGSGKSTTLYRAIEMLNDGQRKIITIEDPVEYDVDGVMQIQVKPEIGYDFAMGLRAILRQDPDAMLVGEIRDGETAEIAARAALTGHFVMSTLHTNSALDAVMRLRNIGLESFLIAASLKGVMAQRLVRRLCDECSEPINRDDVPGLSEFPTSLQAGSLERDHENWRRAIGCPACDGTGYKGRLAISELFTVTSGMKELIESGASLLELEGLARSEGYQPLFQNGLEKAKAGLTTMNEVLRVCADE